MTGRKLFQLQLKTEELGRGSRLRFVGIIRFSLLRICGWRGKLTPKRPAERQKETGRSFPMAVGNQRGVTSRLSGEALQKKFKNFLASWSLLGIIPGHRLK
jgi:hypothetical protein